MQKINMQHVRGLSAVNDGDEKKIAKSHFFNTIAPPRLAGNVHNIEKLKIGVNYARSSVR